MMPGQIKMILGMVTLAIMLGACSNRVVIESTPPGATVFQGSVELGQTPLTIDLHSADWLAQGTAIRLELAGFHPVAGQLDWTVDMRHWAATVLLLGLNLHPRVHRRLLDHYHIILEEDLDGTNTLQRQVIYGRDVEVVDPSASSSSALSSNPTASTRS